MTTETKAQLARVASASVAQLATDNLRALMIETATVAPTVKTLAIRAAIVRELQARKAA